MLEFLKDLFGTGEDGQPKSLTYDQLEKAAASAKDIKAVNLASGGYVSKDKFDAKSTELEGVEKQLKDANATIKSYKISIPAPPRGASYCPPNRKNRKPDANRTPSS